MLNMFSMNIGPSTGGGGQPANMAGRAGSQAIADATQSAVVVFSTAMPNTSYALMMSINNLVDASPIFLQVVDTVKAVGGFTATFNAPTDSANYVFEYIAILNV